jgi:hypothetical protein
MDIQPDFKELLELFNSRGVEYLIVGGYALAYHGAPRYTGDMDLFVRPSADNAERVMTALREFGFGSVGLTKTDFTIPANVVQLGVPPVRVDIVTSLTGVSWEEAYAGRSPGVYGDVHVYFIGRNEFVRNKRAVGRTRDLADLEEIGEE